MSPRRRIPSRRGGRKVGGEEPVQQFVKAGRRINQDRRVLAAVQKLRNVLPGDNRYGDRLSTAGKRRPQWLNNVLSELSSDRPGALGQAGLGALQLWEALSEAQGRGRGKTELAIAFTDLVDFSNWALTAGDTMAIELLRSAGEAIEAPVGERGGTVVKRLGDGMMAVFPDVDRAVGAILEGRQRLGKVRVPNYKPRMRAGIHLGRPRKVGGDYFGVDVNVAARVAEAASAGELLLSDSAVEGLESDSVSKRRKPPIEAKGVPEGFTVYAVTRKRGKRQSAGKRARKDSSSSKRASGSSSSSPSSSRKRATR